MNIAELAKSLNVSEIDCACLAQSVANSMKADGLSQEHATPDVVLAYVVHAAKKFEEFQVKYFTNPEARKSFILNQYELLKS